MNHDTLEMRIRSLPNEARSLIRDALLAIKMLEAMKQNGELTDDDWTKCVCVLQDLIP